MFEVLGDLQKPHLTLTQKSEDMPVETREEIKAEREHVKDEMDAKIAHHLEHEQALQAQEEHAQEVRKSKRIRYYYMPCVCLDSLSTIVVKLQKLNQRLNIQKRCKPLQSAASLFIIYNRLRRRSERRLAIDQAKSSFNQVTHQLEHFPEVSLNPHYIIPHWDTYFKHCVKVLQETENVMREILYRWNIGGLEGHVKLCDGKQSCNYYSIN